MSVTKSEPVSGPVFKIHEGIGRVQRELMHALFLGWGVGPVAETRSTAASQEIELLRLENETVTDGVAVILCHSLTGQPLCCDVLPG